MVELRVGRVAHGGHCVARLDGRVVFVRHALPGELVTARLEPGEDGDRFWRADAVEVLEASPDRVTPPCPLAGPGRCGGCDWQHASLAAQRRFKAEVVVEQLTRLGGVPADEPLLAAVRVEAVEGDTDGLGWRTRMRFTLDSSGRPALRGHRSHRAVTVPHCPIAHPDVEATGVLGRTWRGTQAVDVVAAGVGTGVAPAPERLVVVDPTTPGGRVSVPPLAGDPAVAVRTRDGLQRLRGRTWVREAVAVDGEERAFRVTGSGFWQVHPGAAAALVDAVLAAADPRPGEVALDLYSGVGLFAAALALRVGVTGRVLGVESDPRAAADARRNLHDLPQVTLETARVERALPGLLGGSWSAPDVVVLDPPRAGAKRAVLQPVLAARPRVVVYVACDPASLARDVATAAAAGYRLTGVRAFDLFPMTHHVECVATLTPSGEEARPAELLS